eukprot:SAG22_NODE_336_length_12071_cov_10.875125_12_plen_55_part_00
MAAAVLSKGAPGAATDERAARGGAAGSAPRRDPADVVMEDAPVGDGAAGPQLGE